MGPNLNDKEFLKKFEERVRNRRINHRYYFDLSSRPVADFYIRFEDLNNDYKLSVCSLSQDFDDKLKVLSVSDLL